MESMRKPEFGRDLCQVVSAACGHNGAGTLLKMPFSYQWFQGALTNEETETDALASGTGPDPNRKYPILHDKLQTVQGCRGSSNRRKKQLSIKIKPFWFVIGIS